jgi:hypothetical protein
MDQDDRVVAHHYSIIGENAGGGGVRHVGLLAEGGAVGKGDEVVVFQMGPPLYVGQENAKDRNRKMIAHAIGCVYDVVEDGKRTGLTPEEQRGIGTFIERLRTTAASSPALYSYIAHPAWAADRDPVNKKLRSIRFSCAGFVARAYFEAGIPLIERIWSEGDPASPEITFHAASLPPVQTDVIDTIWRDLLKGLSPKEKELRLLRILGPKPWRPLLAGYLLHAVSHPRSKLPYTPQAAHWQF